MKIALESSEPETFSRATEVKPLPVREARRHFLLLFLFALLAHGPLLLNDGVYWDGLLYYTFMEDGQWDRLYRAYSELGLTQFYYIHLAIGKLPQIIFGYKLATFSAIFASAWLTYRIAAESGLASRRESWLMAAFSLAYPAYQLSVETCVSVYLISYFLFILGVFLSTRVEFGFSRSRAARAFYSAAALIAFFLSFTTNSLLVFYLGFGLFIFIVAHQGTDEASIRTSLTKTLAHFLLRHIHYILLPIAFWILKKQFLPITGSYTDYNQLQIAPASIRYGYKAFFQNAVFGQCIEALSEVGERPILWLIVIAAIIASYRLLKIDQDCFSQIAIPGWKRVSFAFGLLLLGMLPYVLVGKVPNLRGWETRHSLLIGLPMAILIVTLARAAFVNRRGVLSCLGWTVLGTLLLLFNASTIRYYASWQARWVKDRSVMLHLASIKPAANVSIFRVNDRFDTQTSEPYRYYEWSSLFNLTWGDESRIGINETQVATLKKQVGTKGHAVLPFVIVRSWNLSEFDPNGAQAKLLIEHGPNSNDNLSLSTRYLFFRFFQPQHLNDYLRGIAVVKVVPLSTGKTILTGTALNLRSAPKRRTLSAAELFNNQIVSIPILGAAK